MTGKAEFDAETLQAAGSEEEGVKKGPPKFNLVAYNGGKMVPSGRKRPVVLEMSGITWEETVPVLMDHNREGGSVVGHGVPYTGDGALRAQGVVSGATAAADTVVESAKAGFPWKTSIGAQIRAKPEYVPAGSSKFVNGHTQHGPFDYIAKAHLHEISFVPIGADNKTSAAIAAKQRSTDMDDDKVTTTETDETKVKAKLQLDSDFEAWLTAQGIQPADLEENVLEAFQRQYKAKLEHVNTELSEATDDELKAAMRKTQAEEIRRIEEIRKVTRFDQDLTAKAIEEGWSVQDTELHVLRGELRRAPQSMVTGRVTKNATASQMECRMLMDMDVEPEFLDSKSSHWNRCRTFRGYAEQDIDAATDLGTYSFSRLFREFLHANGISYSPGATTEELIPHVKNAHRQIGREIAAAGGSTGMSTINISGILSNVLGKRLLAAFNTVRPVAQRVASSRSVPDFKETKAFRLTGNGDFLPLGPGGELQAMQLQEEEYANRPETFGRLLSVDRQMLINDDLGALGQVTQILGRKAALKLQKEFFTMWVGLETAGFFAAGNNNLINDALTIGGLTNAETAFLSLEDADEDPIDVEAELLLVPQQLKVPGEELMESTTSMVIDRDTSATATTRGPTTNPHVGKWSIEWSPWLPKLDATNGDTAWYLVAPSNVVAAAEIVYLNGRNTPTIEGEDSDFAVLGFQWRSYFDFGVAPQDYRGAVKSTGTVGTPVMMSMGATPMGNPVATSRSSGSKKSDSK